MGELTPGRFQPLLSRVEGFPTGIPYIWTIAKGPRGLLLACEGYGLLEETAAGWRRIPCPAGVQWLLAAAATEGEYCAGGVDCLARLRQGKWEIGAVTGYVRKVYRLPGAWWAAAAAGTTGYLGYVWRDGDAAPRRLDDAMNGAMLIELGEVPLLVSKTGCWRWQDGGFESVAPEKVGVHLESASYTTEFWGLNFGLNSRGVFCYETGAYLVEESPMPPMVTGLAVTAEHVWVTSNQNGLHVWSRRTRQKVAQLAGVNVRTQTGDRIYATDPAQTLVYLHDPARLAIMPKTIQMASFVQGADNRLLLSAGSGLAVVEGASLADAGLAMCYGYDGRREVYGGDGFFAEGGKVTRVVGTRFYGSHPLPDGAILAVEERGLKRVSPEGDITARRDYRTFMYGYARCGDGRWLLGGTDGVTLIDDQLVERAHLLAETCFVWSDFGAAWISNAKNEIFDEQGRRVAQAPSGVIVGVTQHEGRIVVALDHGADAAGEIGYVTPRWEPLRVPLRDLGVGPLQSWQGRLYVATPRGVVRLGQLQPIEIGTMEFICNARDSGGRWELPAAVGDFELSFPSRVLPGENTPRYAYEFNGEEKVDLGKGRTISLPRLPYGESTLKLHRDYVGFAEDRTLRLYRPYPWYFTGWALGGYGVLTVGGLWWGYRWRTGVLRRRAQELERRVEERTAELVEAKRAREYFISAMSHEIRNPLNGVVGLCEMLHAEAPTPRARSLTATLQSCAQQLRSMLDDVMDWSRIERGELAVADEPFELATTIEAACRAQDPELRDVRGMRVEECWLRGDGPKLRQIVMNLVSNGLKHGQPRGVEVTVTRRVDEGRCAVRLEVANAGPQFSAAEIEGFFAEYHRGEDARRRRAPGLGLGLHISRRLATAMGGALTGRWEDGRIVFALSLELPTASAPEAEGGPTRAAGPLRLLALEDEVYNRLVLGHLVGRMGCRLDWAQDEPELRRALQEGEYAAVLTDFSMPTLDGLRVAEIVREVRGAGAPPILAVTAYSTDEKRALGSRAGIVEFVTKPVSAAALDSALRRHVAGWGEGIAAEAEPFEPEHAEFDLSLLDGLGEPSAVRRQFADDVERAWREVSGAAAGGDAPRAVHALRARVLVVRAKELAEQLALLEAALRANDASATEGLRAVAGKLVARLVAAIRAATP